MQLDVSTFRVDCTDKDAAVKVLEEASEAFNAWQEYEEFWHNLYHIDEDTRWLIEDQLADELADCITACCNLADRYGLDMQAALDRVERRNRERGRYDD